MPGRIELPSIQHVVAVASGKGGVGKSTVTVNLAFALARSGARVGLLDADIYGPSIPLMVGLSAQPTVTDAQVIPLERDGVKVMSIGFLVSEDQPVVWRGPMVHGALTQFMTQVEWGELDYLLIDMPPGTGDAQLTISQSAPLSGAIIVTTPQAVSVADARKGAMMFQNVKVPILGVVENMAGSVFGSGGGQSLADQFEAPLLASFPLDSRLVASGDQGSPVVLSQPESDLARQFMALASDVAGRVTTLRTGAGEKFRSLGLDWQ